MPHRSMQVLLGSADDILAGHTVANPDSISAYSKYAAEVPSIQTDAVPLCPVGCHQKSCPGPAMHCGPG